MKKEIKIFLDDTDLKLLKEKSENAGFKGRGAISHYISYLVKSNLLIVDSVSLKNLFAQKQQERK